MKINKFETREAWLAARRGKITGSRLHNIVVKRGTGKKIGFYELIAERLGVPADGEDPMERGQRLESEAKDHFTAQTKMKINSDLVIWTRDDNESIAISPDGTIGKMAAVEVKCLSSARHIEALLTKVVPDEYEMQMLQYFIVNDKLKTLYFIFYDPRLPNHDFFWLTINRKDLQGKIDEILEYERNTLKEVDEIVSQLSNF